MESEDKSMTAVGNFVTGLRIALDKKEGAPLPE
jgi:hypothetical protein